LCCRPLTRRAQVLLLTSRFSALVRPHAETLRVELLELWLGHKIPTPDFIVCSHSKKQCSRRLSIVLGRLHPAHPRGLQSCIPHTALPQRLPLHRVVRCYLPHPLTHHFYKDDTAPSRTFVRCPRGRIPSCFRIPFRRHGRPLGILAAHGGRFDLLASPLNLVCEGDHSVRLSRCCSPRNASRLRGRLRHTSGGPSLSRMRTFKPDQAIFRKIRVSSMFRCSPDGGSSQGKSNRTLS